MLRQQLEPKAAYVSIPTIDQSTNGQLPVPEQEFLIRQDIYSIRIPETTTA
jgi:hypothetical protein